VGRNNTLLQQAYMQAREGAENTYRPKFEHTEAKVARNMTINSTRKVFGLTPMKIPPACIADQE